MLICDSRASLGLLIRKVCFLVFLFGIFFQIGCAALFGWKIHAPGVLSNDYFLQVKPARERVALYLPAEIKELVSENKGAKTADPQNYYVGEAYFPMCLEAFTQGFEEFILMEVSPTPEILDRYKIPYLVSIQIEAFNNRVTWKGQAVEIVTETVVYDSRMKELERFRSSGLSDAQKVFSKKGGPEVNLNAAIENNLKAIVSYLQDSIVSGKWKRASGA